MYECIFSYCPFKCETHPMIIEHACSRHQSEPLQFRKVVVHPSSGKFGYSRILYNELIPLELKVKGNSDVIVVTVQSENTPHSKKKMKAATNCKWLCTALQIAAKSHVAKYETGYMSILVRVFVACFTFN